MSADQTIALISAIGGVLGSLIGIAGFIYGLRKDKQQDQRFKQETINALQDDLIEIMTRGIGGTYIPGMSESAGEQLKARVYDALKRHLAPKSYDWKTHKLGQQLKEQSKQR